MTERGRRVVDVAKRLAISDKSLYLWVRLAKEHQGVCTVENRTPKSEVFQLKAELNRTNEKRDMLKNPLHSFYSQYSLA